MISATAPTVWGPAMLVPLAGSYSLSEVRPQLDRMLTPGAVTFGFKRLLPSTVTGPRLLKPAMLVLLLLVAPTEIEAW
jgi:hypothetical protein